MSSSILVGYATQAGSTQEVAEAIAAVLREGGFSVDCQTVKALQSLEAYRAVVLGAPLYMFRWHTDAKRFLSRHRQALAERPVAVFALGPVHENAKEFTDAHGHLDKALLKYPWFAPAAIEIFGGKYDPAKLRFPMNLVPALKQMPASDIRNWTAIRAWVSDVATMFQPNR